MAAGDKIIIPAMAAGFVSLFGQISKGAGDTVNLPEGMINIGGNGNGYLLAAQTDFDPVTAANRDASFAALALGDDIYLYAVQDVTGAAKIIASKNITYPTGYDATNSRKLGGFHYGRVRAVDVNEAPIDSNSVVYGATGTIWEANVSEGIVPNSVWDLGNRPTCDPTGMAKVGKIWVDIYLASVDQAISISNGKLAAGTAKSVYGGTPLSGTELLNWYLFNELGRRSGKRYLNFVEWLQASEGSPQGNDGDNVNAWSATTNVARAVCGTVDRAVSGLNVVDCVGNVWEWLDTLSVNWLDTGEVGQGIDWIDAMPGQGVGQVQILDEEALVSMQAGGYYFAGVRCGSRSVNMLHPPWYGEAKHGCRFCCDAL